MTDYNIKTDSEFAIRPDEAIDRLKGALLHDIQRSAYVYRVDCGGCNGCEIEIFAAITPVFDAERFGIKVVSSPRHADILVYTGAMTRSMRVPALRAYHAAPDPKICVAYGACGCSGGIFHDLYCVWGGADKILPIDFYIPGCPPTPPATIHGFAVALGLLKQKMKAVEHVQQPGEKSKLIFPDIPLELRIDIERAARRMAGYWQGKQISATFMEILRTADSSTLLGKVKQYLEPEDDPRLTEIMFHLVDLYQSRNPA
ncbi:MAG: hydrogenase [Anaerolineae bacterium UTCFX2]|jgi:Ni,Fe-hydrogenase III small subunit|nr:NADH-quinone oxidoreductase subunit B family protein [Anaerolineales bacterium]OQY87967.1 MAG: hydrogenase [Anaerolineae bacterium UTCFX2]